jgi:hypothetical protein
LPAPSWIGLNVGSHVALSHFANDQATEYAKTNVLLDKNQEFWHNNVCNGTLTPQWWTLWKSASRPEEYWRHTMSDLESHNVMPDMPAEQLHAIKNDLNQMYMYLQTEPWVLRNLTLRNFVRSDSLLPPASVADDMFEPPAPWKPRRKNLWTDNTDGWMKVAHRRRLKSERIESERVRADQVAKAVRLLTLLQIFLVLTMYSARGWPYLVDFHIEHDPWNTHSFDVVPLSVHLGESREDIVWQDISAAIAADVGHLRWSVRRWAAFMRRGNARHMA